MDLSVSYDLMAPGEEERVCDLVLRVFNEFVAPDYPEEGVHEFISHITPKHLIARSQTEHTILVARRIDKFLGVIDIHQHHHNRNHQHRELKYPSSLTNMVRNTMNKITNFLLRVYFHEPC